MTAPLTSDIPAWVFSWIRAAPSYKNRSEVVRAALAASRVSGLFCEFGVYTGDSMRFIADSIRPRILHGFDAFQGLPKQPPELCRSGWPVGAFKVPGPPQNLPKNTELHIGWFADTLPKFVLTHPEEAAFLHCDADLYTSTATVLEWFAPKIVRGTVILFDEFLWWDGWERQGEARAWAEYVERTGTRFECLGTVLNNEQVAVRITA